MSLTCAKGATAAFNVVAMNDDNEIVPLPGPVAVASSDANIATATVQPDGSGGVLSGVAKGGCTIVATSGSLNTNTDATVTSSQVATQLAIVPAA